MGRRADSVHGGSRWGAGSDIRGHRQQPPFVGRHTGAHVPLLPCVRCKEQHRVDHVCGIHLQGHGLPLCRAGQDENRRPAEGEIQGWLWRVRPGQGAHGGLSEFGGAATAALPRGDDDKWAVSAPVQVGRIPGRPAGPTGDYSLQYTRDVALLGEYHHQPAHFPPAVPALPQCDVLHPSLLCAKRGRAGGPCALCRQRAGRNAQGQQGPFATKQ